MADKASEIVEEAKKEALETTQNYSKLEDVAKTNIQKSYENKLEAEVKHARYETSKEVLGEVMVDLVVSNDTVVKTILKKVG
jgi:F0F1-type ATP synthase membrane subunit b/b'